MDMLYGSYGERLAVTYKQAKEGLEKSWTESGSNSPGSFHARRVSEKTSSRQFSE